MSTPAQLEQFRRFAAYNRWMNERLYAHAGELPDEARTRDLGAFFGSLHRTLNHLLLTDRVWLARFRRFLGGFPSLEGAELVDAFDSLGDELFASFAELRAGREATDAVLVAFADELTEARLLEDFRYRNTKGVERNHALWIAVAHLFNHQTHHRGQATTLLHQLGRDPGVTDFLAFATM